MATRTGVTQLNIEADSENVEVTIRLIRGGYDRVLGPTATELPDDFKDALLKWLDASPTQES